MQPKGYKLTSSRVHTVLQYASLIYSYTLTHLKECLRLIRDLKVRSLSSKYRQLNRSSVSNNCTLYWCELFKVTCLKKVLVRRHFKMLMLGTSLFSWVSTSHLLTTQPCIVISGT